MIIQYEYYLITIHKNTANIHIFYDIMIVNDIRILKKRLETYGCIHSMIFKLLLTQPLKIFIMAFLRISIILEFLRVRRSDSESL